MYIHRGFSMRVHVKRWGNSASVRLPASVMAEASLVIDQPVEVRAENGRVVIEPVATPEYDLDVLLAQMDPARFPDPAEFGPPVGNEVW